MLVVTCPHCGGSVEIVELNCRIFRHGVLKSTGEQMAPHCEKVECDRLAADQLIYGCGKPFRIDEDGSVHACEYI